MKERMNECVSRRLKTRNTTTTTPSTTKDIDERRPRTIMKKSRKIQAIHTHRQLQFSLLNTSPLSTLHVARGCIDHLSLKILRRTFGIQDAAFA